MQIEILTTADGSSTLRRPDLDETYHSRRGAWSESEYVYIEQGLKHCSGTDLRVLEFGFGTGMNALLSCEMAMNRNIHTEYITSEKYPVPYELAEQLLIPEKTGRTDIFLLLHRLEWDKPAPVNENFTIFKQKGDFKNAPCEANTVDVIFYDAFAPSKQPDAWETDQLAFAYNVLKPGGILVTYCAQGQFKRNLRALGFDLEKLPGALGKGEMTRATKPLINDEL